MGLVAGAVAEFVDGGVGASAAGFGGAVAGVGNVEKVGVAPDPK